VKALLPAESDPINLVRAGGWLHRSRFGALGGGKKNESTEEGKAGSDHGR